METYHINFNMNEIDETAREVFYLTMKSMDDFSLDESLDFDA